MHRIPTKTLAGIAALGGVSLLGSVIGIKYVTIKKFQQTEYYQEAVRLVLDNEKVVEFIGTPINFGNPDLGNYRLNNYNEKEARFVIPIKGSHKRGRLYLNATRELPDPENIPSEEKSIDSLSDSNTTPESSTKIVHWKIKRLELALDDKPNRKLDLVSLIPPPSMKTSIS